MKVLTLPLKYLPRLGLYSWYEWCCLFHPTGRLVIKTHAKPNLGQSFKFEIGSPSQVSTRFIHWFFFLLPSQSYSSQESSCLGRCNSLVTSRRNFLAVCFWPLITNFFSALIHRPYLRYLSNHTTSLIPFLCPFSPNSSRKLPCSFLCYNFNTNNDLRHDR